MDDALRPPRTPVDRHRNVAPPLGTRRPGNGTAANHPFEGGDVRRPGGLRGTLAPGGADWQFVRSDGTIEIDAHYVLETDGGARDRGSIDRHSCRHAGGRRRITAGDPVDPSEYYFRTHIRLTSADESLRWMNDIIAVSAGERRRSSVRINVFELT